MFPVRRWFRNLSLARKLTAIGVATSTASVVVACVVILVYDVSSSRARLGRDAGLLADVVGDNSTAALLFGDTSSATQTLGAVAVNRHIVSAAIVLLDGQLFAQYVRDGKPLSTPPALDGQVLSQHRPWQAFSGSSLLVARPIELNNEMLGMVLVESDVSEVRERTIRFGGIIALALMGAMGIAVIVGWRLQRVISTPLLRLADVTRTVTRDHRYDLRVEPRGRDEIGELVNGFNEMLEEIQDRDRKLLRHQEGLEQIVESRTAELRITNTDLISARDKAMDASRAKSEFLANMSHEIRTPMNGVMAMTELLLLTDLDKDQREYAGLVQKSADSLLAIINDILDFSKVESGKLQLETIDFVLRTAIEEVADLLAERAQSKGVEMACLIHHDIPVVVRGDPGRLRQILTNLLGNSIKFTEAGEVVLRAKLVEDSGPDVTIRFEISDTGIGISREAQSRLFQSFSQADGSTTRRFGGSGLGLVISKRLTELMGGEIGVESEPGQGSTFWFTVRLSKIPAHQIVAPAAREDLRGLYAIAVDDNQTNLQLVQAQTRSWGMVCDVATQGAKALQMIRAASDRRPYDLALLDMQMPGMDGLELAQAITRDPVNARLKLVLMTSMAQRGHAAQSEQAGIAGYLNKPVRQSQLYDCLRTVMGPLSDISKPTPQPTPRIVTTHSLREAKDVLRPRVLLAEDNQTNQMAAVRMLERLGFQVDVAVTGIEAVEACRTVDYGIVLMDNQMPEMDGLTAAREVRAFERAHGKPPVPIVALTANAMQGDREKCLAAGMSDYLSKPFKVAQLSEMLERWIHRSPSGVPVPAAETPAQRESPIDPGVFHDLRDLEDESGASDFVNELIDQYLAESTLRMASLKGAVERRDAPAARLASHSLKGASSTVGANRMAALCAEMETLARKASFDGSAALVLQIDDEFTRVRDALHVELLRA